MAKEFATSSPVRVQRAGNSRVLPLPAELARVHGVDFGDLFTVEFIGEDEVVYHRATATAVQLQGTGRDRFGVVPDCEVMPSPVQRVGVPPLDWDF